MSDPRAAGADELGVLIAAGGHEPERLLMIGRPAHARVHVREWSTHNWAGPPDERDDSIEAVYALCERASNERRRMTAALPRIRAWLDGRGR
ncbi:MAG TPA: hypothetical protein VIC55_04920 [Gemmatimonadaceae bacterium]|jgi:hypothetical protein